MAKISPSPLRYPGGKSTLLDLLARVINNNQLRYCQYAEPYAGGCGLALSLLYGGYVKHIHINDIDPAIWSFWHTVLNHNEELIQLVENIPITLDEWHIQKHIHAQADASNPLTLGFATFFLNRTNRSGIIKGAGVIGGKTQNGAYTMGCRFNREDLVTKIRRIHKYKERITLYNLDAIEFMSTSNNLPQSTLFFIDPPYYNKGASLYTSFYKPEDHTVVAQAVKALAHPWLVTYDNTAEISQLYKECQQYPFNINYSLQVKRKGSELLIASKYIHIGTELAKYQIA